MRYVPPSEPWSLVPLDDLELLALKSIAAGKATGPQQQLALKIIVQKFAATYDLSFRPGPDGERATSFSEGKRFVGQRIVEAIERPMKTKGPSYGGSTDDREAGSSAGRRNPKPERGAARKPAAGAPGFKA